MPYNMTVGCKVEQEIAEKLKAEAKSKGIGVNHLLRGMIEEHFNPTFDNDLWGGGGLYDDLLDEMAKKLGKDTGWLVATMKLLVDGGYFYTNDNGRMMIRSLSLPEDDLSVDLQIDLLNVPAEDKLSIKRRMINEVNDYVGDKEFYIGNGAGV